MPRFKQSPSEYNSVVAQFEKSILPAVIAPTDANGQLTSGYMLKHFQDENGIVDASVPNLRKAVTALHDAGLIDWTVAPRKRKEPKNSGDEGRPNHAREDGHDVLGIKSSAKAVRKALESVDEQKAKAILGECERIVTRFTSNPHSKTYAGREALQAELKKLLVETPKPSAKRAAEIKAKLQVKEGSLA